MMARRALLTHNKPEEARPMKLHYLKPGDTVTVRTTSGAEHTGTVEDDSQHTVDGEKFPLVGSDGLLHLDGVTIDAEHIESVTAAS
jgi:plastocyanin